MAKKPSKSDQKIISKVESVKAELEGESMNDIFQLNNKQTFSKEEKPKEKRGLNLWGTKH